MIPCEARPLVPARSAAMYLCSLLAFFGGTLMTARQALGDECAQRCEAKLVRITVGELLKVEIYNRNGTLVTGKPIVTSDSVPVQELLKIELARVQQPVPLKGKECEKGCRCVADRNDPSLKWIENPGNFTITVTFTHLAGKDVFTWKVKREVAIASGICDTEPPQ